MACCVGLKECHNDWQGVGEMHTLCLDSCAVDHVHVPPSPMPTGKVDYAGDVRLMSFNIWYGNNHMKEIADLIEDEVNPDIVNLQEAVNWQPAAIVESLNKKQVGEWKLANNFSTQSFWCGLNAYRSDRWELEWSKSVPYQGSRGICGARLRRKADGRRLCTWGTHPIWFSGEARSAEEGIRAGAEAMKECAQFGAVTAFMCDCNTFDANAISRQLAMSTGWQWKIAHTDAYDQIHIQTGTSALQGGDDVSASGVAQEVAAPVSGRTIEGGAGPRGCQANCANDKWAGADHAPVVAEVHLA